MKNYSPREKNVKNLPDRLSCAVRSVLDGRYSKSLAIVMFARPNEFTLFNNTIDKHTKNVFC